MSRGIIFDIKEFAVHDGPGIRITVFFKGCPLRCLWCHNPEGLLSEPQAFRSRNGCDSCGKCEKPCNHNECKGLGYCVKICPKGLIRKSGVEVDSFELATQLKSHEAVLKESGGGITISGGEPLMQPRFLLDLLSELRPMHTLLQTSGYGEPLIFQKAIELTDLIHFDIKLIDIEEHLKYTGVDNDLILHNLNLLKTSGKPFTARLPIVCGVNDSAEHFKGVAELLRDVRDRVIVELLPYNPLAGAKYASVNMEYKPNFIQSALSGNHVDIFKRAGITYKEM